MGKVVLKGVQQDDADDDDDDDDNNNNNNNNNNKNLFNTFVMSITYKLKCTCMSTV